MNHFMTYFLLGISLAAPIGSINAAQLERGARLGFTHAWLIGLGAMCADLIYMLLIYFGLAHFLTTPFLKTFLWFFGSFVLLYTGIESLQSMKAINGNHSRAHPTQSSSFRTGFLMSLMNPLSILFWLGIYGPILADSIQHAGARSILLNSAGIFTGILLWDIFMAGFASSIHRFGSPKLLPVISAVSGLSLIGFGLYFGYQAICQLAM
ncbi:LysE family translocator [Paenibacillus lutrae]|uniref:Amino acid transporter n=1 Tax=Paenibacillus lutrae TaxID=2078573 RepID=A0A7X3FER8_9BACL|nr:LysE family translocator [Paenibacillus lutrae]MVO98363.1 amino acid transporter [Paenibacillus lutrae]